jgi:nucleotide-binding universal stress UspA family protein
MTEQHMATRPNIVVGVDGSEPSKAALAWAIDYATLIGATIDAVISWSYPSTYGVSAIPSNWSPADDAREALATTVAAVMKEKTAPELTQLVREGNAAQVLLDEAKDAAMLVVGSRGHGGFAGLLLGSVSANCAEHAQCPVLVLHGKD